MTVMRGYQPNDPAYGFIIYRRTSGLLKQYVVKDGADHTLQLGDHTKVTADVTFEVTLDRNAPPLQVANFLLDTTAARSEQINGAQLWRLDVQKAWWSGCDDEMSAAMRRFSVTVPKFTEFQR